jgi:transcriptional regulator with XRE-family HTH domain
VTPRRVNQARFLLGWSTEQLARTSGVSAAQIAAYEAGGWIHPLQLASVSKALAAQGIEFLDGAPVLKHRRQVVLTAEQCRAGRALLGWSQRRLGAECGIPGAVITTFEKSGSISPAKDQPRADRLAIIRTAFETAGLDFAGEQDSPQG